VKGLQEKGASREKLLETFESFCKGFHPVLRHYFTEQHKGPIPWFTTRLAYTRSVATTSIVGHVLGLGDRHASNILMDHKTGEVVHIDLGIAFDQVRRHSFRYLCADKTFKGSTAWCAGECSVSDDGRHQGWDGYFGDRGGVPTVCGGDATGAAGTVGSDYDGA